MLDLSPFLIFSESNMERDKFMSPEEAKAYNLIDTVLEHPPSHIDEKNN